MFIIKDWAGNVLDFKGKFKLPQLAVAMEFDSFEDAWEYIDATFDESCHEDLIVDEMESI